MTIFIDASALVAMLGKEPEAHSFAKRLNHQTIRLCSPIVVWEAVRAVERVRGVPYEEARRLVADFVAAASVTIVPIGMAEAESAMDAHQLYGRGIHKAGLNMGDCFAYACAKQHDAEILFKGEDFIHTDLKDAMLP